MKGIGLFILGFVAGILFTVFVLFLFALGKKNDKIVEKKQVQYVEIKGKKGKAEVYIGMPKDSVYILAGKPDDVDLNSIGNTTYESWGYKINDKYISDLNFRFEDGELVEVRQ
jgi:hypothetical protein